MKTAIRIVPSRFLDRRILSITLLIAMASFGLACHLATDMRAIENIRAEIHNELGVDSSINVNANPNGSSIVTVHLLSRVAGEPERARVRIETLVHNELPSTSNVVIFVPL